MLSNKTKLIFGLYILVILLSGCAEEKIEEKKIEEKILVKCSTPIPLEKEGDSFKSSCFEISEIEAQELIDKRMYEDLREVSQYNVHSYFLTEVYKGNVEASCVPKGGCTNLRKSMAYTIQKGKVKI